MSAPRLSSALTFAQALLLTATALIAGAILTYERGRDLDAAPRSTWSTAGVDGLAEPLRAQRALALWTDLPAPRARVRQFGLQSVLPPAIVSSVPDLARAVERLAQGQAVLVDSTGSEAADRRTSELLQAAEAAGLAVAPLSDDAAPRAGRVLVLVRPTL